jgi:hypothetical protein
MGGTPMPTRNEFPSEVVVKLLVACHRRCCICHRFCGIKMEIDHIVLAADGGPGDEENAVPVCFDCHAEIHSYNPRHPKGRKFTPDELRGHRDQWLTLCQNSPETLLAAARDTDVGPLQALLNELEFNQVVAKHTSFNEAGCCFKDEQFERAIRQGAIWSVDESVKSPVLEAYTIMGRVNTLVVAAWNQAPNARTSGLVQSPIVQALTDAGPKINEAREALERFLGLFQEPSATS